MAFKYKLALIFFKFFNIIALAYSRCGMELTHNGSKAVKIHFKHNPIDRVQCETGVNKSEPINKTIFHQVLHSLPPHRAV